MILPAGLEKKQARIEDKISENIFQKDLDVKKKSVSLQPISEERVLERVSSTSEREQIIDNIGKDNEVKQQKRSKKRVSYIKRYSGMQFQERRERELL